jgi:predicted dithiol-disulfide oxidoreductase (DUF899 family)
MPERLHDFRFPGESDDHRRARDELLQAEVDLRRQIEHVAAKRRRLPPGGSVQTDYPFEEWDADANAGRQIRLSELFEGGKDTLFLYSFMVVPREQGLPFVGPCPSCTSIIDGIDGPGRPPLGRPDHRLIPRAVLVPRFAAACSSSTAEPPRGHTA